MKTVDTREYVSVLKELAAEGKEVRMLITGSSMSPFLIHQRDSIFFTRPERKLKKGDMVFYERPSGQYVMHRICRVKPDGFYMAGDAQNVLEGPVDEKNIFGLITRVERKGRILTPENLWWRFFEKVWIHMLPVRQPVSRLYAFLSGKRHRERSGRQ